MAGPAAALDLPSGLSAELADVLVDQVGSETWVRFRFIAPALDANATPKIGFAEIEGDFAPICRDLALPYMAQHALSADKLVISLSDRAVPFGETVPDAIQFFEQFRPDGDDCIWEAF